MTGAPMPPHKILAVLEGAGAQTSLATAAALADKHSAAVEVLCCVEPPHDLSVLARLAGQTPERLLEQLCTQTRDRAAQQLASLMPDRQIPVHLKVGKTFIEVIRHVIDSDCDFVVKQAEPLSGMQRFLFASTDQHLLRKCPCPVWLQTPGATGLPKRIIAAVDVDTADAAEPETLTSLNRRVLATAQRVAATAQAQITVLHAWDAIGEGMMWAFSSDTGARAKSERYVNAVFDTRHTALRRLIEDTQSNTTLTPRLARGAPEQVIKDLCQELDADLVVMGTVARTSLSGVFIGNTAENIINSLSCPVLAVKPDGFVSPLDTRQGHDSAQNPDHDRP